MENQMQKCMSCKNLNREASNENWVVCPKIPVNVILEGSSENCNEYSKLDKEE